MKPTALQYREILSDLFNQLPATDPYKEIFRVMISCQLTTAEVVEGLEQRAAELQKILTVLAPKILGKGAQAAPSPAPEQEDNAPLAQAAVVGAAPVAPQGPSMVTTSAPVPIKPNTNGGGIVTTSAPVPITPSAGT